MALSIKHAEADKLARELASRTGEGITEAVLNALRERLARHPRRKGPRLSEDLRRIGQRCAALPVLEARTAEEIIGYDDTGTPR